MSLKSEIVVHAFAVEGCHEETICTTLAYAVTAYERYIEAGCQTVDIKVATWDPSWHEGHPLYSTGKYITIRSYTRPTPT